MIFTCRGAGFFLSGVPKGLVLLFLVLVGLPLSAGAQLDHLEYVGHNEDNPFHLMHAEIVGSNVYVSEGLGSQGMETYDVTNPAVPLRVDQDGPTTWRTRAYPAQDLLLGFSHLNGVQLYDISGPATLLGEFDPPAGIGYEGGALDGNTLYVAAHQIGIEVFDVTDPALVVPIETIDLGDSQAWDVEVVGSYLLVANGRFGLAIVDLNAGPPAVVAALPFLGLANDILLDGDVAYMSLGPGGLVSIDVSDPGSPILLDHNVETAGNVTQIDILDDLLVAGSWKRLETYDISNPLNIQLSGWDDTKTWAMGASINDDTNDPLIAVADWRGVSTYRPNADAGPDIELSMPRIDFGSVPTIADTVVFVYNRGSAPLEVTDIVSPPDILVGPTSFTVPPGGVEFVTVAAIGPVGVSSFLRYVSNDPDQPNLRQHVYMNNVNFAQIGSQAPDFDLEGTDGGFHRLSDQLEKVVFLEFGANW